MFSKIATLLQFFQTERESAKVSEVTVDVGGGVNHTADHFSAPNDDSHPLTIDYVVVTEIPQSGTKVAIGYLDPVMSQKTAPGEKRIYSRDPNSGFNIAEVWLKNDGTILINNDSPGFIELQPGGTVNINGATINTNGEITCSKITTPSAVINGVEHATHVHAQPNDGAGDAEANTTGPQ